MIKTIGWLLQVLGLVTVGTSLLVGLSYDRLRLEVALMAVGGIGFLVGRWLHGSVEN